MPPAARLGDMHTCPLATPGVPPIPHVGGPILPPCCPTVLIGFLPAARVSDMALCVGPPDVIAKGSPTVLIGGLLAARMGDLTVHGGVITVGCPTVIIGEAGAGGAGAGAPAIPMPVASLPTPPLGPLQPSPEGGEAKFDVSRDAEYGPSTPWQTLLHSQQQEQEQKTWIGLRLHDFQQTPLANYAYKIVLNNGQVLSGRTDNQGYARHEGVKPGAGGAHIVDVPEYEQVQGRGGEQGDEQTRSGGVAPGPPPTRISAEARPVDGPVPGPAEQDDDGEAVGEPEP